MEILTGFAPDPERARAIDRGMHAALAASLQHIVDRGRGALSFDEAGLQRLIAELEGGTRYPASTFADYYELGGALIEGEHRRAEALMQRLAAAQPAPEGQIVRGLADAADSDADARYARLMSGERSDSPVLRPPGAETARDFEARYADGMALMERAMPELAGEVRAIVHEVVAVVGDPSQTMQFDGGSHFQLWGALFLNADFHPSDRAIVEVVAHESAHSLLFGFCTEEPLVHNDDDQRFRSPLRRDARPMDGIFHATFVLARMHWAMARLADCDALPGPVRDEAAESCEQDRRSFYDGYRVVAEHGQLSATGAALMDEAKAYMDAAAT